MKDTYRLRIFLEPLSCLQKLMKKLGCKWMVIGGVAASLLGKPRFTADIDIVVLIEDKDIQNVLSIAERFDLRARIKDAKGFALKNRVLLFQHRKTGINIDVSLGLLPLEKEAIKRSTICKIDNITLRLPTAEDLIIFKAIAHRPQDIIDIREIVNNNPGIDKAYIKKKTREFARALGMPEIWLDVKRIIST